ncbi:hypothetical protein [Niabella sp.]|uniref:hypothetical protein n=1 Tax=Niabella sp. TaxID=1962976 RepID=UPI002602F646|nr:hypothetical protein [Niabella sp.]
MKKSIAFLFGLVATCSQLFGQSDPQVSSPSVSPSPSTVGGVVTLQFTFQNANTTPLAKDPTEPTRITVSLNKVNPLFNGKLDITGAGAAYFDWTYDPATATIFGTQNKNIPGMPDPFTTIGGPVTIRATVTAASTPTDANNNNGDGFNVNIVPTPGTDVDVSEGSNNVSSYGYTSTALPVSFGTLNAALAAGKLSVSWSTLDETNNDRFRIEVSKDGEHFVVIDSVKTKATAGNTNTQTDYHYETVLAGAIASMGVPGSIAGLAAILVVLSIGLGGRKSRKGAGQFFMLALGLGLAAASCKKSDHAVDTTPAANVIKFVRIGQVDLNGVVNYSKVVKVEIE